ncbi:MAG TPA: RidA family protein [Candidatus Binataceae bacterium]|jgi:enamine deaminase RidA (YjgF/YER057c/UK114 family)|nr:RidA family protein [Candidatus Binataceae bacterium]
MERSALKPPHFPWYDYSRYTFSLGLNVGRRTLLSGHSASEHDPATRAMEVRGGMREQARTAWAKIAAILEAGGRSLADVVRVVEYVTPAGIERYAEAAAVRGELFGANRPAVNTVVVNSLLRPQALIEVEIEAEPDAPGSSGDRGWPPAWAPARAVDGFVYLSSILPLDDTGALIAPGDPVAQTRAVYERAARVLEAFGLGLHRVVKTVDYLTPAALPDYRHTGRVRREMLGPVFPAATGIIMRRIADPRALIQIDLIASRHQPRPVNPGWGRYAELTYNPAVGAGDLLFLAGQAALDPASARAVYPGDVAAQAAHIYENILRVVAAAGGGPENLVKTVEYVTPAALERYREVAGVRSRMFQAPFPVSTGCVCETLLRPEFMIEVDSLAIIPSE